MFENLKAQKAIDAIAPTLKELDQKLAAVDATPDPIDRLVKFFNAVAPIYDQPEQLNAAVAAAQKAGSKFTETAEALRDLQVHVQQSGRDPYGWNRTEKGETVTGDNVYLGNIYGRFTKTANYWQSSFSRDHSYADEDRQIIGGQAKGFVESHVPKMHKDIAKITAPKR
ncbi:MAG TPA: hypothetical protein VEF76_08525 [Patescibacteria group bacterium]|nr:hypothetical protein [Patescibacteria group bacterium]